MKCATISCPNDAVRGYVFCATCYTPKRLTGSIREETAEDTIEVAARPENAAETIQRLLVENQALRHKLDWAGIEYQKLNEIYTKLADQWNAFQATMKPTNRNVHRAEASGELARKLAEVFISLAYDKDARQALLDVLSALAMNQTNRLLIPEDLDSSNG